MTEELLPLPQPSGPSHAQSLHAIMHFVRAVRSRLHLLLAAVLATGLLGGLYYTTAARLYQSKASLLVMQDGGDIKNVSLGFEGSQQSMMPTYERLVTSEVVLESALEHLPREHRAAIGDSTQDPILNRIRRSFSASTMRQTNIIELGYRAVTPETSQAVVAAVLRAYLEFLDRTQKGTAGDIVKVLTNEKIELERKLALKEAELLEQRRRCGDLGIRNVTGIVHPLAQRAISMNESLVRIQQQRLQTQAALGAITQAVRNGESLQQHMLALENAVGREFMLSGLGFNQRDSSVQAAIEKSLLDDRARLNSMQEFFGPQHPQVIDMANRIRATDDYLNSYQARITQRLEEMREKQLGPMLIQIARQRLGEVREHEASLRSSFEQARQDAVKLNGDMARLEILEHDLKWLRELRDVMLNQIASIDLKQDRGDVRTAVISDPSLPSTAIWPKLSMVVVASTGIGMCLGLSLIYILDLLDDRFRSPEELRRELGAPVLAMVRQLEDSQMLGVEGLQVYARSDSVESEAFSTLRTTLAFGGQETSRLVVSSAEPGDGKTTILANLACSFAQAGKRVLLVDADMRRPGLTALMSLKGKPGLSDLLVSDEAIADLIGPMLYKSPIEGLHILPAGPRRPNPAEMLSGQRLADLLAWAEGEYDQVLIDSPPTLAATDASIIGRQVDGLILVVQPRKNQRRLVIRASQGLADVDVPLVGIVVNRIGNDKQDVAYGYGYGYGYGYTYGHDRDEQAMMPLDADSGEDLAMDDAPHDDHFDTPDNASRHAA
jgi:capsular exopolysaccharide synthesis family protein